MVLLFFHFVLTVQFPSITMVHQNVMIFLISWIGIICTSIISGQINITYLKGLHRLSRGNYTDYYISCNADGRYLQWHVDNQPIIVFGAGSAGRVVVGSRINFEYTATLLSSQPLENGQDALLDSILIVSISNRLPVSFIAYCRSDSSMNETTVSQTRGDIESTRSDVDVTLDFVLSSSIVRNKISTYVFMCGAASQQQFLTVDNFQFLFNQNDQIGDDRTILSADSNIVSTQSVLIAQHPFDFTSIVFIPENIDVVVTCYFGSQRVQLSSRNRSTMTERNTEPTTIVSSQTAASTMQTTALERNAQDLGFATLNLTPVLLAIAIVILIVVVIVISGAFLFLFCYYKKKKTHCQDLHKDPEKVSSEIPVSSTPVQEENSHSLAKLVNGARVGVTYVKVNPAARRESSSSGSTSQDCNSEGSTTQESMSDEMSDEISADKYTTEKNTTASMAALETNETALYIGLHSTTPSATEDTPPERCSKIELTEILPKQDDDLRSELKNTNDDTCMEMEGIVSAIVRPKRLMEMSGQEMLCFESPDDHGQESKDAVMDRRTCAMYICNGAPIKLPKKSCTVGLTGGTCRVPGPVVAGRLMTVGKKDDNGVMMKTGSKQRTAEKFYPGIRVAAQCELASLDKFFGEFKSKLEMEKETEVPTLTSDECQNVYAYVCLVLGIVVNTIHLFISDILFNISTGILAVTEIVTALEQMILNLNFVGIMRCIAEFQTSKSCPRVCVYLLHSLHYIATYSSKTWWTPFNKIHYMSPMSSTS